MLDHFKQSLTKLFAAGKERIDIARVRSSLERLEDRTMLSASYGMMAYNYGGPSSGPHGGSGQQKFNESAAFASQQQQPQRSVSYNSQSFAGVSESGYGYREYQNSPPMQTAFAPPPRINGGQRWDAEPGWNQFVAAPPHDNVYAYRSEPITSSHVTSGRTYMVTYYYFENVPVNVHGTQPPNSFDPDDFVPPRSSPIMAPPNGSGGIAGDGADPRRMIAQGNHIQLPSPSDLPIAPQILSRETTTVAALNAVGREVAFQEFSSNLFQSNPSTAYDRVNIETFGHDTTQPEIVDGLIHPTDESTSDVVANSSDAVAREREAVDAVLEELHDVDSLLPATESQDLKFSLGLQTETALDELPAGEVAGGMVLLQSTGDANGSGFDLTQVYAEHVERFSAPAKMETSVGMFQAIDVATDDAPIVEAAPRTESTSAAKPEIKLEENLPTKRAQSSNKAAAVIGATTVAGALVWLNRSASRLGAQKPTAQKRRVARG